MTTREFLRREGRIIGWSVVWVLPVVVLLRFAGVPYGLRMVAAVVVGATVSRCIRRRSWVRAKARWKVRHRLHEPIVVDEDGRVHIPVLLPDERADIAHAGNRVIEVVVSDVHTNRVRLVWPHR